MQQSGVGRTMYRKRLNRGLKEIVIGALSFLIGATSLTISTLLLFQSVKNHQLEGGPDFARIYAHPFKNSNWMKSSIPAIVISSFTIVVSFVQMLTSVILMIIDRKFRMFALVIWIGAHILIFIFNVICFFLAVSVKAHEAKDSSAYFWKNYQFQSTVVHNPEGHVYCSLIAVNSVFILVALLLAAPNLLSKCDPPPISLPNDSY